MNPEDRARQDIDRQLGQCGWVVQDKGQMNISAALGIETRTGIETGTQLILDSSCVPVLLPMAARSLVSSFQVFLY